MKSEKDRLTDRHSFPRTTREKKHIEQKPDSVLREIQWLAGYSTDPSNPNSMSEKDSNALKAIALAGQMLEPLLKWALDHLTGRIMLRRDPIVPATSYSRNDARLRKRVELRCLRANSHENEWVGNKYDGRDPRVNREVTSDVFYLLSREMGFKAGQAVSVALKALEKGEVYPELNRVKSNRMEHSMELDRLRVFAVGHVEFRRSLGNSKEKAMADVCNAYEVSENALKKWGVNNCQALKSIDETKIADYLFHARQIGLLVASKNDELPRKKLCGPLKLTDFSSKASLAKISRAEERFSVARLEADGEKYRLLEQLARQSRDSKKRKK